MSGVSPTPPSPDGPPSFEDLAFVRDAGPLSPTERTAWEPDRVRFVREGWLMSGAIGFAVAVGRTIFPIIVSADLSFSRGSVIQIVLWASGATALCALRLVRPRVVRKRDEFMRTSRLRDAILRDTASPDPDV